MRLALIRILPAGLVAVAATVSLAQTTTPATQPVRDGHVQSASVANGVYSITLPPLSAPEMPSGPDADSFTGNCMLCHTPRYVLMQPPFSRKTWQAEVEKMKKVYGAPIADDQIPHIVDYLVSIRGK